MKASLSTLMIFGLAGVFGACSGSSKTDQENADSTKLEAATPRVDLRLPDTILSSVDAIKYTVTVADSTIDGKIYNFDDLYAKAPGGLAFRGGPQRDAAFGGRLDSCPTRIDVDWTFYTEMRGTWGGGSGWNGQPVYVNWPDSCVQAFKKSPAQLTADFGSREIIVGSLAGKVYFINFDNGKASRSALDVTNPIKGSVSLDPTLNGNLYVGQGIPETRPFGALVVDLYKHSVTHTFGEDPKALRHWGAYDSSPLRVDKFLFRPAENGSVYKFEIQKGGLRLHSVLRYSYEGMAPGIESSIAVYRNYGYVGDNRGNILCINLDTMRPVWRYFLGDDTDASPVVQIEGNKPVVYVACEVDKQGNVDGKARVIKLNAIDGSVVWKNETFARTAMMNEKAFNGGYYATPLPGTADCKDMIFVSRVLNTEGMNGCFVAIDRNTGKDIYSVPLKRYGWSSPVGFVTTTGQMYVFAADCVGNVYLIEGKSGKIVYTANVGDNFESSPVVVGNSLVVGSRGNRIFKMTLK